MPDPVSRRHTDERLIVLEIPYDKRSLYVGLDVSAMPSDVEVNSKDS